MSFLYWTDDQGPARGQKVLLATTAYDNPDASHTASVACARAALAEAGVTTAYALLSGNCHVDDARNSIVAHFLASDCTDLVFIDADVSFGPADLVRLCTHDVDIVGGVYPKRAAGHHDMPVRMFPHHTTPGESGLLEVEGLPTGFLRIKRGVLKGLAREAQIFRKGHDLTEIPLIFERTYRDDMGRVGGDINFCLKAREAGWKLWADCELRLGHAAKVIVHGSLGGYLRRQKGETLAWLADRIKHGAWQPHDFDEAREFVSNDFTAGVTGLVAAVTILKDNKGHVLETGSGLSTICMAAALHGTGHYVYCLEHDPVYGEILKRMARQAGVNNIALVGAEIDEETGWYSQAAIDEIPVKSFALGFCDGPPRVYNSRIRFAASGLADRCGAVIFDDADSNDYQRAILDYARRSERDIVFDGRIAIVK